MASLEYTYGSFGHDYINDFIETPTKLDEELFSALEDLQPTDEEIDIINIYTELLFPSMKRHQREVCTGCIFDHPSQLEHDVCMMMSKRKFLNFYLNDGLAFIPNMEVNRIARNRASGVVGPTTIIPLTATEWKPKWFTVVMLKLLKLFL